VTSLFIICLPFHHLLTSLTHCLSHAYVVYRRLLTSPVHHLRVSPARCLPILPIHHLLVSHAHPLLTCMSHV
jgi:hypothetical protein